MAAVPIKPQYGPTLGQLLSPRWRAASPLARRLVIASGVGLLLVAALGAVLTLENAKILTRRQGPVQLQLPRPLPGGRRTRETM